MEAIIDENESSTLIQVKFNNIYRINFKFYFFKK